MLAGTSMMRALRPSVLVRVAVTTIGLLTLCGGVADAGGGVTGQAARGVELGASAATSATASVAAGPRGFVNNVRVNRYRPSLSRPQVEPSITSDPRNRLLMVAGYSDSVDDVHPGVSRSTSGGVSWSAPRSGAILPAPPGYSWGPRTAAGMLASGDPSVSWSVGKTVYYAVQGFEDQQAPPSGTCANGGLYVYRSTNNGATWTLPSHGPAVPNTETVYVDKPYIAADSRSSSPFAGNVYAVWSDDVYAGCPQVYPTNFLDRRIMFARSTDHGITWSAPMELASGCLEAADPAVARGGMLYVAWFDCTAGSHELVRRSADGGLTWSAPVAAASGLTRCPQTLAGSQFRTTSPYPSIATDPTRPANVYLAYPDCPRGDSDVFVVRSTDRALTWSAPIRVNDDPATDHRDQFFPWMAVADNGVIRIIFGDDRRDQTNPAGRNYDIYLAESRTHGRSFARNLRVTSRMSDPTYSFGGSFIGDYFGIAPCGTAIWTDTRNGNPDIFAAARDANHDGKADSC